MTPQAFSYPTVSNNGKIYIPPYGLDGVVDYMLKFDPVDNSFKKIKLKVNALSEKWQCGIAYRNKVYFLPYNEDNILVVNTDDDSVEYVNVNHPGKGKYIQAHIHGDKLIALPYGEHEPYDYVLTFYFRNNLATFHKIKLPKNDSKKWHTTQMVDGIIYGLPRGENWEDTFNYRISYDCNSGEYEIADMSPIWLDYNKQPMNNKKYTTMAKVGNRLYAPPYSENPEFDILSKFVNGNWYSERTGIKGTSRKYFSHTVASNGKVFFPPAGHDENWSEMLVVDSVKDDGSSQYWHTIDLGIGKESKKYFAGIENSKGKIYYIPRGGCVCEPEDTWKSQGDLNSILVIDIYSEKFYTIDIDEHFKEFTTIEKYNKCVLIDDVIYAFPYGESKDFHQLLVFDTLSDKVLETIDLRNV